MEIGGIRQVRRDGGKNGVPAGRCREREDDEGGICCPTQGIKWAWKSLIDYLGTVVTCLLRLIIQLSVNSRKLECSRLQLENHGTKENAFTFTFTISTCL